MAASFSVPFEVGNNSAENLRGVLENRCSITSDSSGETVATAPVVAVTTVPTSTTSSPDAVILCHGFRSSSRSTLLRAISSRLSVSSAMFDFSGNGSSDGMFQYGNYAKEVEDLRSVVTWVRNRGFRVKGILGHSKGGNVVLLYGAKYNDIDRIVNLCGRFDLKHGVRERIGEEGLKTIEEVGIVDMDGYTVTKAGLEERLSTDMSVVTEISSARILHVHGSEDTVSHVSESYKLNEHTKDSNLVVIEGADHLFTNHLQSVTDVVVPFLEQT